MLGARRQGVSRGIPQYESVSQLKGSISQANAIDSAAFLRANYMQVLESYQRPPGVLW